MAKKEKDEEKVSGAQAVAVYDKNGNFVREYTLAEHGDTFVQLAEQFAEAKKNAGRGYTVRRSR